MIFDNRRSEIEILDTILSEAISEVKKTHLQYTANVCYTQFSDYFDFLLARGFLSAMQGETPQKTYIITEKGRLFHQNIKTILSMIKGK